MGPVPNREGRREYDVIVMLVLLLSLAVTGRVDGEIPTAGDVAACNQLAPHVVKTGGVSPIVGDHPGRARARSTGRDPDSAGSAPRPLPGRPPGSEPRWGLYRA